MPDGPSTPIEAMPAAPTPTPEATTSPPAPEIPPSASPTETFPPPDTTLPTDTPSSTESTTTKTEKETGVPRSRQTEEAKIVGSLTIEQKIRQVEAELRGKKPEEVEKWLAENPDLKPFRELLFAKDPSKLIQDNEGKPITFKPEDPYIRGATATDGSTIDVTQVVEVKGDIVTCKGWVKDAEGKLVEKTRTITKDNFYKGKLLTEGEKIIAGLPDSQREAARLHLDILRRGEAALEGKSPEEINKLITETADGMGLLTREDLEKCIDKHFELKAKALLKKDPNADTNVIEKQKSDLLEKLQTQDINLADPETLSTFLSESGVLSAESIGPVLDELNAGILSLTIQLKQAKGDVKTDLEGKLAELKVQKKCITKAQEALNPENIQKFFKNLEDGNIPTDTLKQIKSAMRNADSDQLVKLSLLADTDFAKETAKLLKDEHRAHLVKLMSMGGGLAALAMVIMMYGASKGEGRQ